MGRNGKKKTTKNKNNNKSTIYVLSDYAIVEHLFIALFGKRQ